jgi:hypothetical protein
MADTDAFYSGANVMVPNPGGLARRQNAHGWRHGASWGGQVVISQVRVCWVGVAAMLATSVMAQPTSVLVESFSHFAAGGMPVGWE